MREQISRMVNSFTLTDSVCILDSNNLLTNVSGCCPLNRLQDLVIDLEVRNQTPSPSVDPGVHVFLLGHSMGGIVAADMLILLSCEQPIRPSSSQPGTASAKGDAHPAADDDDSHGNGLDSLMFPHIQGLLAFDTPFLGVAPSALSYSAEGQYRAVANTMSDVATVFGLGSYWGRKADPPAGNETSSQSQTENRKGNSSSSETRDDAQNARAPSWQRRWGRYAMFAGAIGAATAGGAAAVYRQRQNISSGLNWVSSHLAFIGCLTRPAQLRERLEVLDIISLKSGIGCTNFYTFLGEGAQSVQENTGGTASSFTERIVRPKNRTFCVLPREIDSAAAAAGGGGGVDDQTKSPSAESASAERTGISWIEALNNKASDEIKAHTSMFLPNENPGFDTLVRRSCDVIANSVDRRWYATSSGRVPKEGAIASGECEDSIA